MSSESGQTAAEKFLEKQEAELRALLGDKEYEIGEKFRKATSVAQKDSDRSAGIVFPALVEIRLEYAIRNQLTLDDEKIASRADEMFRSSGPLGSFSNKIDLGAMLGIYCKEAWRDLVTIKNIRNGFAHRLEFDSFSTPSINSWAMNLKFPNKFMRTTEDMIHVDFYSPENGEKQASFGHYLSDNPWDSPRGRLQQTCNFFTNILAAVKPGHRHRNLWPDAWPNKSDESSLPTE